MPELSALDRAYPDSAPDPAARERARIALLEHVERRPQRVRLSRRALLPAAGLACAVGAVAVALVGVGNDAAIDARAASMLREAAVKARAQAPLPPVGRGRVLYVKSVDANMLTWADRGNFSVRVPHVREIWLGPDGGLLRSSSGEPEFLSERDRQRWIAAGRPVLREGNGSTKLEKQPPSDLPTDPDALFARLEDAARGHSKGTYVEMFTLVGDAFRETNVRPAQRAALYEVAARLPGVELVGQVRDSVGRQGVAVAMEERDDGIRHTLVIEPKTGTLLAEEQATLAKNVFRYPAGTVIGRSTYLDTRMVTAVGAQPK